jgi:hypothetical protein
MRFANIYTVDDITLCRNDFSLHLIFVTYILMYLRFSNLNSIHWIIKNKPLCTFQDISDQFSGHYCNPQ